MAGRTKAELEQRIADLEHELDEAHGLADDRVADVESELGEARDTLDGAREELAELKRNLAEHGFAVSDFDSELAVTPALLARHVAAMKPWERANFDRLLAEETGDAWTRLPKVAS